MISRERYTATLTVPNRVESVRPATAFLVQVARGLGVPGTSDSLFEVAVTEALSNAVKHGRSPRGMGTIVCEIERAPEHLTLRISDEGRGFTVPEPRLPPITPDEPETLPESGFGLPIIQAVFPMVRGVRLGGRFVLELSLPVTEHSTVV
jgi:serine/threonine-protein kinase RsbW